MQIYSEREGREKRKRERNARYRRREETGQGTQDDKERVRKPEPPKRPTEYMSDRY